MARLGPASLVVALLFCAAGAHAVRHIPWVFGSRGSGKHPAHGRAAHGAPKGAAPAAPIDPDSLCMKQTVLSIEEPANTKGWMRQEDWGAELRAIDASKHPTIRIGIDGFPCAARGCCQHSMRIRVTGSDWYLVENAINEYAGVLKGALPFQPTTVLDAGANIGVATVLFALMYPHAQIVALEPQPENFALLQENVKGLPNVAVHSLGLWDAPGKAVELQMGGDGLPWAWRLHEVAAGTPGAVQTTSVPALLRQHGLPAFDMAKLDIEGAEFTVLGGAADRGWLAGSQALLLEIHDAYGDGAALRRELATAGYNASVSGEYDAFLRPSVLAASQ